MATHKEKFDQRKEYYKTDILENYNNIYDFVDFYYTKDKQNRNQGTIKVKHYECGEEFERIASLWKTNKNCAYCSSVKQALYLHIIVSEVAKKLYAHSVNEYDIGFKGTNGGISKYDLFIPNLRGKDTLVEFQSRYHDDKTIFDNLKAQYAIDNGYVFYNFDSRFDTIYNVIEVLFKLIEIPFEIKINSSKYYKQNILICQKYIDENMTVKDISKLTGISENIINHALNAKILKVRSDRKRIIYKKSPVVQLDICGNYIREFDSSYQVYKDFNLNLFSCLSGISKHCGGYLWVKKDDYYNGNYKIPNKIRIDNKTLINHIEA